MLANIESAHFITDTTNSQYGAIQLLMNNTTINGYKNLVLMYQDANTFSMPNNNMLVDLDVQSPTQMQVTGFNNRIQDNNYSIQPREWSAYNQNWYMSTRINGVEIQQAQTSNKENMMMGQSTNKVIVDILDIIQDIILYLASHTHTGGTISGDTGPAIQTPPNDSDIIVDETYINGNKNLAITGTYEPK